MSLPKSPAAKAYVDRGIQTVCPPVTPWLVRSVSNSTKNSSIRAHNGSLSEYSSNPPTSTHSHSRSSSMLDSAYSHSLPPDSPSPVRSTIIARRMYKRQRTPYSRPSPQKPNKRIASLPEDLHMLHTKTLCESTTVRVVSLPNRLPSSSMFTGSSPSSDLADPSIFVDHSVFAGDEQFSRIRVRPPSVDEPHTPSPPSSPDSVLIIENNHQLPETFLRSNPIRNSQQLFSDDEGWITWATSPPRPIPALHGPLSLPYARCPSGAEGTIIEEHDNLPRMIWGLGADDAPSTHSRVSSQNPHHVTSHTSSYPKAPPRLQKKQASPAYLATPQLTPTLSPNPRDRPMASRDPDRNTQAAMRQRALENLGSRPHDDYGSAMALDNMLRLGTAKVAGTWDSLYGNSPYQPQDPVVGDGRPYDVNNGIALGWQSALAQRSLRNSVNEKGHEVKATHFLKPSAPVFVPSGQAAPSPFPRIFVEPRSTQTYKEHNQSRIPAIEIAQKYRQQRMHQNVLPTPPSSSSPQWSSNFSPYQGSLYSPDVAPPRSVRISNNPAQKKQRPPADSSNELCRFVYERISGGGPNKKKCLPSAVSPSNHAIKSPPAPTYSLDVSYNLQRTQHLSTHSSNSVGSPPHPGPPPSTPLPPLPSAPVISDSKFRIGQPQFSTTPPSPTSPEARPRSLSYQHPRSIPLARLVQRRLSSVPEEDLSSFIERNCTPPTPLSTQQTNASRTQKYVPSVQIVPQDPTTQQYQRQFHSSTTRTPSPIPAVLTLRSKARREFDSGEFLVEPAMPGPATEFESFPAKVRLPYTPLQTVEQPKGGHDDKVVRRSEDSKENSVGEARRRSMNFRKKGHGKKNKASSNVGMQVPTRQE